MGSDESKQASKDADIQDRVNKAVEKTLEETVRKQRVAAASLAMEDKRIQALVQRVISETLSLVNANQVLSSRNDQIQQLILKISSAGLSNDSKFNLLLDLQQKVNRCNEMSDVAYFSELKSLIQTQLDSVKDMKSEAEKRPTSSSSQNLVTNMSGLSLDSSNVGKSGVKASFSKGPYQKPAETTQKISPLLNTPIPGGPTFRANTPRRDEPFIPNHLSVNSQSNAFPKNVGRGQYQANQQVHTSFNNNYDRVSSHRFTSDENNKDENWSQNFFKGNKPHAEKLFNNSKQFVMQDKTSVASFKPDLNKFSEHKGFQVNKLSKDDEQEIDNGPFLEKGSNLRYDSRMNPNANRGRGVNHRRVGRWNGPRPFPKQQRGGYEHKVDLNPFDHNTPKGNFDDNACGQLNHGGLAQNNGNMRGQNRYRGQTLLYHSQSPHFNEGSFPQQYRGQRGHGKDRERNVGDGRSPHPNSYPNNLNYQEQRGERPCVHENFFLERSQSQEFPRSRKDYYQNQGFLPEQSQYQSAGSGFPQGSDFVQGPGFAERHFPDQPDKRPYVSRGNYRGRFLVTNRGNNHSRSHSRPRNRPLSTEKLDSLTKCVSREKLDRQKQVDHPGKVSDNDFKGTRMEYRGQGAFPKTNPTYKAGDVQEQNQPGEQGAKKGKSQNSSNESDSGSGSNELTTEIIEREDLQKAIYADGSNDVAKKRKKKKPKVKKTTSVTDGSHLSQVNSSAENKVPEGRVEEQEGANPVQQPNGDKNTADDYSLDDQIKIMLISKVGAEVCYPKTVRELNEFKKNHPDAEVIVVTN